MKKMLVNLIVIAYVAIAIFTTICLLTYNDYKVSEFGDKSLIIIDKEDESLPYNKGDLVIVGKENYESAKAGDIVFFYQNNGVKIANIIEKKDYGEAGIIFVVDGNYQVVHEDVIGTSNNVKVFSKAGGILSMIQSKWGFLFLIVFPSLIAFLHEIYQLILELTNRR